MRRVTRVLSFLLATALLVFTGAAPVKVRGQAPTAGLKILVIEGGDAVNIVQQKTAVAPVIEVRDRNDQPVAGAVVRFAIQSGRASFGGARTLTVTTNAVGRAAVTSLTPTGGGALQISATAAFQGQTAAITIAQTNVMTAAQAATAASAGGAGGGGGGAGAAAGGAAGGGTGGGLSATAVAIVGGAAAGGTLALKELGVLASSGYVGSFSGIIRYTPGGGGCFRDERHEGEIRLQIDVSDSGAVSGSAEIEATATVVTFTSGCAAPWGDQERYGNDRDLSVTGTTASLGFHASEPGAPGTTWTFDLTGALNGTEIAGTYTETVTSAPSQFGGSQSFQVTLKKP